ncbi:MAG TPA: DNA (cytosine-5-)-methyltransferase [Terriglobales bacterium]|nr:DNA (cytosine-5-)-methyltransferase [Terriglobales bacterium]
MLSANGIRYVDLFCGIGGFRLAIGQATRELGLDATCALSCDIDESCQDAYEANFGERPLGDIRAIVADDVPDHNLLLAGFPCQPFSIIGSMLGFEDTRGTLFFEICRILERKKPEAFVLENVKLLVGHKKGRTLKKILHSLAHLGYAVDFKVLNSLDFGLPQKRERIFIVGFRAPSRALFWPQGVSKMTPLEEILEKRVAKKYYASDRIIKSRLAAHKKRSYATIWHENKAGHISAYPYSCALRAGASYNYLLVNGERRLTPREMLRLQGFPDTYKIVCNYSQTRKQAGNSVSVPVVSAVLRSVLETLGYISGQEKPGATMTEQYAGTASENCPEVQAALSS